MSCQVRTTYRGKQIPQTDSPTSAAHNTPRLRLLFLVFDLPCAASAAAPCCHLREPCAAKMGLTSPTCRAAPVPHAKVPCACYETSLSAGRSTLTTDRKRRLCNVRAPCGHEFRLVHPQAGAVAHECVAVVVCSLCVLWVVQTPAPHAGTSWRSTPTPFCLTAATNGTPWIVSCVAVAKTRC